MHRPLHIILVTISPFILLIGYLVLAPFVLSILGYYPDALGWKIAEQLAYKGGNGADCQKIIHTMPHILSPSTEEQRAICFYEFAALTKNPLACEQLLPNEYGMRCIGNIWGPLIDESNCHWLNSDSVRCFEGKKLTPHIYDCTNSGTNLIDECWHRIAFKKKDPAICESIKNVSLRSVCEVRIDIWQKYPQLRSTIYFNDDIK